MSQSHPSRERRRIAVLVHPHEGYWRPFREALEGVFRFARVRPDWHLEAGALIGDSLEHLAQWQPEGIIGTDAALIERVPGHDQLPYVTMLTPNAREAHVIVDDREVGRLAARHLQERGYERFAFCGQAEAWWAQRRLEGLTDVVGEVRTLRVEALAIDTGWGAVNEQVATWLGELPRPIAIFAADDPVGRRVLNAADAMGLGVPHDVGVLGCDDDAFFCATSQPALSSIAINWRTIGRLAADMLDQQLQPPDAPPAPRLVKPTHVVVRQSTNLINTADRLVHEAAQFIASHLHERIDVRTVADHVNVSRRTLEMRCKQALDCTPHDLIRRAQLDLTRQLLADTDLPLDEIAHRCGMRSASQLVTIFRKNTGQTPGQFRETTGQ